MTASSATSNGNWCLREHRYNVYISAAQWSSSLEAALQHFDGSISNRIKMGEGDSMLLQKLAWET